MRKALDSHGCTVITASSLTGPPQILEGKLRDPFVLRTFSLLNPWEERKHRLWIELRLIFDRY